MSIRIQNDGIAAASTGQTAPAEKAGKAGSSASSASLANLGSDQVDISSFSGNIAASSSDLANQQAARVNELTAIYAKGDFQVDSGQLSRSLVSSAIGGGSVDGDS
jgi:anti-sigma28 factor (negative regulator of flagellin synthesis)